MEVNSWVLTFGRQLLGVSRRSASPKNRDVKTGFNALMKVCFFFFTLVTGPRRSLSLKLSDTKVYEP